MFLSQVSRAIFPVVVPNEFDEETLAKKGMDVGFEQGWLVDGAPVIVVSGIINSTTKSSPHTLRIMDAKAPSKPEKSEKT
jgi:hypothetical protein